MAEALLLLIFGEIWTAIGLFGNIYALIIDDCRLISKLEKFRLLRFAFLIVAFIIIKPKESNLTYILDGIAGTLILLCIYTSAGLKTMLSKKVISTIGRFSWGFFLIHVFVYDVIGYQVFTFDKRAYGECYKQLLTFSFVLCAFVTILLAVPTQKLILFVSEIIERSVGFILNKIFKERGITP